MDVNKVSTILLLNKDEHHYTQAAIIFFLLKTCLYAKTALKRALLLIPGVLFTPV